MNRLRRYDFGKSIVFIVIILLGAAGFIFTFIAPYTNQEIHRNCVVTDKDRTQYKDESDMRVYTSCGTFRVKDMIFAGEFNSADTYSSLVPGNTYDIETTGYRVPIVSSFPIIREVK